MTRSYCARAGCQLVFTFNQPMVKELPGVGPGPVRIAFEPRQRGRFAWRSQQELVFTPSRGALPWGHEVSVTIRRAVPVAGARFALKTPWREQFQVPYFAMAGKVAHWPVRAGQPRLVALLNSGEHRIGRAPLVLLYDQPVSPARVARYLRAMSGARIVPVTVRRPSSIRDLVDESVDTRMVVAVRVPRLPPDGEELQLQIPTWTAPGEPEIRRRQLTAKSSFAVREVKLQGDRKGARVPLEATWQIELDSPVHLGRLREHLTLRPKPRSLYVSAWGSTVEVRATLEPGTRYRMALPKGFKDALGNPLTRGLRLSFVSQDLPPTLVLPGEAMALEVGHGRVPVRGTNLGAIRAELRPMSAAVFVRALQHPARRCEEHAGVGAVADTLQVREPTPLNGSATRELSLERLGSGLGCLAVVARGRGSEARGNLQRGLLVQQTGLGLTAKLHRRGVVVWVTRLVDAAAARGARVTLMDATGRALATGTADGQGLASLDGSGVTQRGGLRQRGYLVARLGSDVAVLELREDRLSQPWQFGLTGEVKGAAPLMATIFTDRGAYRPGETVHAKLIVRDPETLGVPEQRKLKLTLHDPRGKRVLQRTMELDALGGASLDHKLPSTATVGRYSLAATQGIHAARRSFRVEEYRVPSFQVKVASADRWKAGGRVEARVQARYLHGGAMPGRRVRYTVTRTPVPFSASSYPQFAFADVGNGARTAVLREGEGKLDAHGGLDVGFAVGHPASAGPARYVVEASVTDVDRQVYAGRLARVVHPVPFYLGLRGPRRKVLAPRERLTVPVVAVTPAGAPRPGVPVTVRLERVDHHTTARLSGSKVQVTNRPVPVGVQRCRRTTQQQPVLCTFRVPGAGQYRVVASAKSGPERLTAGFSVTAGGGQQIAWPRFDHERVELVTDKPSYRPGEVARIMIQSPFRRARGLLTLERGGLLEHRPFEIDGDAPVLSLPITEAQAPNVFASVVLLRGRIHDKRDATGFETGAPTFRIGYAELPVEPVHKQLRVRVSPERPVAHPGQRLGVDLQIDGPRGKASATVMVVDEAVLGLTGHRTPRPLRELFATRPLGVRTAASLLELPHARRARHEQIFPGGDGGDWEEGGGETRRELPTRLRSLFKSTAYWNPDVPLDADGRARFSFALPDNLTTYRVVAVVVDSEARAGAATSSVVVRKPLMVRPIVPRFVHPGDRLRVEAQLIDGTGEPGRVELQAAFDGMRLAPGGAARRQVKLAANGSVRVAFPVVVTGRGQASLRFAARQARHADAVEIAIPIRNPGSRRKLVASRTISRDGTLSLTLPSDRQPGTARLEVVASSSRLGELKDAVDYLMGYPHGCIEQTTSRAYPLVVLKELLPEMGVTVDPVQLQSYAEAGVKRLLSFQTSSGGLAYWPGSDKPHAFGTAFGLTALIAARARGYEVPEQALRRMADYLETSLRQDKISEEMPHGGMADGDTRALFAMTLGRLGRPQPAAIASLWRERGKLTAFGLSFLGVAVSELPGDRSLLQPILAEVRARAKEEQQEAHFEGKAKGGWSMDSPLRTHATALLAWSSGAPRDEMGPKLLTGLLKRRRYGLWGNTQENVFGIMAVATAVGRKAGRAPKLRLFLDGKTVDPGKLAPMGKGGRRLSLSEADRTLALPAGAATRTVRVVNRGAGPAVLTLRAEYDVTLTAKNREPRSNGFEVTRSYETVDGKRVDPAAIPLGSLVRVRLKVNTRTKHNYVAIEDRLPAGLEPLNTSLATTERVKQGKLSPDVQRGLALLSFSEIRDASVAFYADDLPAGQVAFEYLARATTPGTFLRPAAAAEAMYDPAASGATAIDNVTVTVR